MVQSLAVERLETTEESEAISGGLTDRDLGADAGVNTISIGTPDIDVCISDGVAVGGVDELNIQNHGNTGLALAVVLADSGLYKVSLGTGVSYYLMVVP